MRKLIQPDPSPKTDVDIEAYWRNVDENLQNGILRMSSVADVLPKELKRVIEFLNEHMTDIEILGVELRLYPADGIQALVPRVTGQSQRIRDNRKTTKPQNVLTEDEFIEACPSWSREFILRVLEDRRLKGFVIQWGSKSFSVRLTRADKMISVFYIYRPGHYDPEKPVLDGYLSDLSDEQASSLRNDLIATGNVVERGQYTLRFSFGPSQLQQASQAIEKLFTFCSQIQGSSVQSPTGLS